MSFNIRAATAQDAEGLRACMLAAYRGYVDELDGLRLPPLDIDYAAEIRDYPTWVATEEGRVVGGLTMQYEQAHASIANVAVDPACQGRGLGKALMEFAEARAQEQGVTELRLATHVRLEGNLALYRHLGWSEYARDEARAYMKKMLARSDN